MSRQRSFETIQTAEYVSIGELVRLTGMRYSTLKFYTEEGFIPFKQDGEGLMRYYPRENSLKRIQVLRKMKEEGYSIPQIKDLLETIDNKN